MNYLTTDNDEVDDCDVDDDAMIDERLCRLVYQHNIQLKINECT